MSEPQIGALFNDRYLIKGRLGQGGMGVVFEAEDTLEDHRPCAIKIIRAQHATNDRHLKRFEFERSLLTRLRHKNIVEVYEADQLPESMEEERQMIVMELLRGESLKDRLKRDPTMTLRQAIELICQALDALAWAHDEGIVHRDLKPDNLFLCQTNDGELTLKILDFGVAKDLESDITLTMSVENAMIGTPLYMSPEQVQNVGLSPSSDLYAIGVLLHQLIRGHAVFSQPELYISDQLKMLPKNMQVVWLQLNVTAPPLSFEPELDLIIARLLEKEPEDRLYTAQTLNEALKAWLADHPDLCDRMIPDHTITTEEDELNLQSMPLNASNLGEFANLDDLFETRPPHSARPQSISSQPQSESSESDHTGEEMLSSSVSITQSTRSISSARIDSTHVKNSRRSRAKKLIILALITLTTALSAVFTSAPQEWLQRFQEASESPAPTESSALERAWSSLEDQLLSVAKEALSHPKNAVAPELGSLSSSVHQAIEQVVRLPAPMNTLDKLKRTLLASWMITSDAVDPKVTHASDPHLATSSERSLSEMNRSATKSAMKSDLEQYVYGVMTLSAPDAKNRKVLLRKAFKAFRVADRLLMKSTQWSVASQNALRVRLAYYLSEKRFIYIRKLLDRIEGSKSLKTYMTEDLKRLKKSLGS